MNPSLSTFLKYMCMFIPLPNLNLTLMAMAVAQRRCTYVITCQCTHQTTFTKIGFQLEIKMWDSVYLFQPCFIGWNKVDTVCMMYTEICITQIQFCVFSQLTVIQLNSQAHFLLFRLSLLHVKQPTRCPNIFCFRDSSFLAALEISSMTLYFRYVPGKGYKKLYL